MAFDRHMNIVICDAEEYRTLKSKKGQGITEEKQEKRTLGLIILRGDTVVSMTIEGPPPPDGDEKLTPGGPGVAKAVGRGLPVAPLAGAPVGLAGPIRGIGGPMPSIMQPPMPAGIVPRSTHLCNDHEHSISNLNFCFECSPSSRYAYGTSKYAWRSWNDASAWYASTRNAAADGHASKRSTAWNASTTTTWNVWTKRIKS